MSSASSAKQAAGTLPVLPLRDVVVFPGVVVPIYVGRPASLAAIEQSDSCGRRILLVSQRDAATDEPAAADLYEIGCLADVIQSFPLADGSIKALVKGAVRVRIAIADAAAPAGSGMLQATHSEVPDSDEPSAAAAKILREQALENFGALAEYPRAEIAADSVAGAQKCEQLGNLIDYVAYSVAAAVAVRQELLEMTSVAKRAEKVIELLCKELEVCKIERSLRGRVKSQIEKNHREYYLNEKAKAIQSELGDDTSHDLQELEKQITEAGMPEPVLKKCKNELRKLSLVAPMSPESGVLRTYLETLAKLPWSKRSEVNSDLMLARKILDEDHYGLEKVKERIIEHLAVQQRVKQPQGTILCLVGPPGVGKTSLGQSIARATGREFVRMALGGLRDEAEIRGHRRTYVASMPGRILQCMTRAGVRNPVFMLDEIDKLGFDYRGDPAAALLEVLDPEQNKAFMDHYAEVDYDLSEVFFVTTSNSYSIPPALLDRLEIIPLAGYTEPEKVVIAKQHLIPKATEHTGIPSGKLKFTDAALQEVLRHYTREAGVRQLEREVRRICRKAVTAHALAEAKKRGKKKAKADRQQPEPKAPAEAKEAKQSKEEGASAKQAAPFAAQTITPKKVNSLLGVKRFSFGRAKGEGKVGQVVGLAWTESGGELLNIEAVRMPGRGKIVRTGKLGEVMRESIEAAYSVVRARAEALGLADGFYRESDLHVHLPEGAIPKDGPSAGAAVVVAMVSALTGLSARADAALTGEITLRGEVLQVGGIKEKLLAAVRGGIKHVLLPEENRRHLEDIPADLLADIEVHFVQWIDEALEFVLGIRPKPAARPARRRRAAPPAAAAPAVPEVPKAN